MTVTAAEMALFAGAFAMAIASPGPFAAALVARAMAHGLPAALGMAVAGVVGDIAFALSAMSGLAMLLTAHESVLPMVRYAGAAWLVWIGIGLLRAPDGTTPDRATGETAAPEPAQAGAMSGFLAGLAVAIGNPKAALFYAAVFPGFFDIPLLTGTDMAAICALIATIVLGGHLAWTAVALRARRLVDSPSARRTAHRVSGGLLAGAGIAIAAT